MNTLGITDRASTAADYGMFAMLFDVERSQDLETFLAATVGSLLSYDRNRSTQLVPSLTAYFEQSANLTRTAAALHIHINTLLKRLERIDSVLGEEWRTADKSLQLQVGLRLHALRIDAGSRRQI